MKDLLESMTGIVELRRVDFIGEAFLIQVTFSITAIHALVIFLLRLHHIVLIILSQFAEELSFSGLSTLGRGTLLGNLGRSGVGAGANLLLSTGLLGSGGGSGRGRRAVISKTKALLDLTETGSGTSAVGISGLFGDLFPINLDNEMLTVATD